MQNLFIPVPPQNIPYLYLLNHKSANMSKFILIFLALGSIFAFTQVEVIQGTGIIQSEKMSIRADTVLSGLNSVWSMAFLPDGSILFNEKKGELRLFQDGKLDPRPIGGLPEVRYKGQGGLLDIELHPNYAENGWIYLSYAEPTQSGEEGPKGGGNTVFIRAKLQNHRLVQIEKIFNAQPNYNKNQHFGGRIEFDREGYVYLSVGDRGGRDEVQSLSNHRGKVFRLHDDGRIPADNPFVNREGAKPEIFTYGHRNPQGLAIHPTTGEIWEHEHGPKGGDEVNIIRKGNNYGWPRITYGINYNGTRITKDTAKAGMEQPVVYWRPSIAPCGMDFLTSDRYPQWKGNLFVGSLAFRYLKRCEVQNNRITHQEEILKNIGRVRVVREAPDGYLYIGTEAPGMIVRIQPVGS